MNVRATLLGILGNLRFAPEEETAFRSEYFQRSLPPVRLVLVLGALLYGVVFIPFDYWLLPIDTFKKVTAIRLVTSLLLLAVFGFSFTADFNRWWQIALAGGILLLATSAALMTALNPPGSTFVHLTTPAFLLFLLVTVSIVRLRFAYAAATGAALIIIYNAVMGPAGAIPFELLLGNNLMLFSALSLGLVAAYLIERHIRTDYLQRGEIENAYHRLKDAQQQLVQQEKLASLGQLAAGIAHEIKNPLNFVNNFSSLSVELVQEIRDELAENPDLRVDDIEDILHNLEINSAKVNEHGRRADGIVRSMLEHSRSTKGDKTEVDLNALVEEYVNLAYHGMRAQTSDFNCAIERRFDHSIDKIIAIPQELGRVFVNLLTNAFYAVHNADTNDPVVVVTTRNMGDYAEIRIRDHGSGISQELRRKIFEPFFTTKPTGSGTGLGLSIAYDIVTQRHKGRLEVESEEGRFTEFIVALPYDQRRTLETAP